MLLGKIKYKINKDNNVIITESKPLTQVFTIRRKHCDDGSVYGEIVIFNPKSQCFTMMLAYPNHINNLCIGSDVSVTFQENTYRVHVNANHFNTYLQEYCPVKYRRTYNKRTKVYTITFKDEMR